MRPISCVSSGSNCFLFVLGISRCSAGRGGRGVFLRILWDISHDESERFNGEKRPGKAERVPDSCGLRGVEGGRHSSGSLKRRFWG